MKGPPDRNLASLARPVEASRYGDEEAAGVRRGHGSAVPLRLSLRSPGRLKPGRYVTRKAGPSHRSQRARAGSGRQRGGVPGRAERLKPCPDEERQGEACRYDDEEAGGVRRGHGSAVPLPALAWG